MSKVKTVGATLVGVLSSILAFLGMVTCCGFPILAGILATVGVGASQLAFFTEYQPYFLMASIIAIGFGFWSLYFRKPKSSSCCMTKPQVNSCCSASKKFSSYLPQIFLWIGATMITWVLFWGIDSNMTEGNGNANTLIGTLQYFVFITIELVVLFVVITTIVELVMMYIPQETLRRKLSSGGIRGNIVSALFGSVTPFCACSTIPMTVGFLNAGVSFGSVMSFMIASPLLNPIIIGMLIAVLGAKAAISYFIIAFTASVFFGYFLEKIGAEKWVKNLKNKNDRTCGESVDKAIDRRNLPFSSKVVVGLRAGWDTLRPIMGYLVIGVALGAGIYGYLPDDFVLRVAGEDNPFAVPVAAVLGIPLYIRAETAIPIGIALMGKGMSVGAVIALIIGGAGMAIPEMSLMASIFKKKLVAMIVLVIFLIAVIAGYLFNIFM